jgi:hypothetical protein
MEDLPDFERGQIVIERLARTFVTKTATSVGVSIAMVSSILKSWEENISKREQWAKINIDRKRSSYIEKDCLKKS